MGKFERKLYFVSAKSEDGKYIVSSASKYNIASMNIAELLQFAENHQIYGVFANKITICDSPEAIVNRLNLKLKLQGVESYEYSLHGDNIHIQANQNHNSYEEYHDVKQVTIPSVVDTIATKTFMNYTSLCNLNIETGVTHIKLRAFALCTSLKTVKLPSSILVLGANCFDSCTSLENVIFDSDSAITTILPRTFGDCNLHEIVLPCTVRCVDSSCFENCRNLRSVVFGRDKTGKCALDKIYLNCFNGCVNLKTVEFPESLKYIYLYLYNDSQIPSEYIFLHNNPNTIRLLQSTGQIKLSNLHITFHFPNADRHVIDNKVISEWRKILPKLKIVCKGEV